LGINISSLHVSAQKFKRKGKFLVFLKGGEGIRERIERTPFLGFTLALLDSQLDDNQNQTREREGEGEGERGGSSG
jgi:hypothetical protein